MQIWEWTREEGRGGQGGRGVPEPGKEKVSRRRKVECHRKVSGLHTEQGPLGLVIRRFFWLYKSDCSRWGNKWDVRE